MAIPRAQVYVSVTEGLTLSLPVPEVISVQPSKRVCCIKNSKCYTYIRTACKDSFEDCAR